MPLKEARREEEEMKMYCPMCKQNKDTSKFSISRTRRRAVHSYCVDCDRARCKIYYQSIKEQVREANLKSTYGITLSDFDSMLDAQKGRCAICLTDTPGGKGRFHIDHDHDSGKVRGLLCTNCNLGIGNMKDSPAILLAAMKYLEIHGKE
jgi:hypothetical protein